MIEKKTSDWQDLIEKVSSQNNKTKIKEFLSDFIQNLSLEEKINQLQADFPLLKWLILTGLHGYCGVPYPAGENQERGIPPIRFVDGPRGLVSGKATCFPVSMARGASWNLELEEKIGDAIGKEVRARGANYFGGVCINLLRHPAWGRAQETYGEDSMHLGEFGSALTRGIQKHAMACAKHFACNSMENARFKVNVNIDETTLREIYLPHFRKCVDAGVNSIMSAYNKVNGQYCGYNKHLLQDILKKEWKFDGFVLSDFLYGTRDGLLSLKNGLDIEYPAQVLRKPKQILKWINSGEISEEQIDEMVMRILRMKIIQSQRPEDFNYPSDIILNPAHIKLAKDAARESIVLLKNQNNLLPLPRDKEISIGLFGSLIDYKNIGDHGSSKVTPPYVKTPLQGFQEIQPNNSYLPYSGSNMQKIQEIATRADYCICVVGYKHSDEGEFIIPFLDFGGDRKSLSLHPKDIDIILKSAKCNPNTIVAMVGGSAIITTEWKEMVPSILMTWYGGMEGGVALAETIFGLNNPSGKLPCTFPNSNEELPYFDRKVKEITYDYFHGYFRYDKNSLQPAFPFGFGLSYTQFSYSDFSIENPEMIIDEKEPQKSIKIKITLENTGDCAGAEVTQIYIGWQPAGMQFEREFPIKRLRRFQKIYLQPGEKKTFEFEILVSELAFFDLNQNEWIIHKGTYKIMVGNSSQKEDLLEKTIFIQ